MTGPLLIVGLGGVLGLPVHCPAALRHAGQWSIGTALGLYFTPGVLAAVAGLAPALLAGIAWAMLMGWLFYRWLAAVSGAATAQERATAWFAAAIGGASEMAVLGERHGGRIDGIAAAHSLRVLIVVLGVPFGLQWAGLHGLAPPPPGPAEVHPAGLALLAALTLAGSLLLRRWHVPNAWVLGSLAVALLLTGSGVELSAWPRPFSDAAQLLIGCALGQRFTPDFVHRAPRWLAAVALGTLALLAGSAGFAWLLASAAARPWATVLLGTVPGGMAEMCITAKVLQLGVPTVTAFHVTRYVAVLLGTGPLFQWAERRRRAHAG
ncbi:MAG: AbrB family transcriptional regulator [Piscinibacter sp.]|nr:AbrB family transcriptional regulator [Piscinibacter sp.]